MLEPSRDLPKLFWTHPDSSWQGVAELMNFIAFSMLFIVFAIIFIDLSVPRGGLVGILELLEATWELLNPLSGILGAMMALLEVSWPLLDAS